jgi:hypothetical protein
MKSSMSEHIMAVSIILALLCVAAAVYVNDLTWVFTSIFGLCFLLVPHHFTKDWGSSYCGKIMMPLPFVLAAFVILAFTLGNRFSMFADLWPISIVLQAWAMMIYSYMTIIYINNHLTTDMSRRWMLVYSMLIACTLAGLYAYYIFLFMYCEGYPVFNDPDHSNFIYNWYLMEQMTITLFFSIFYTLYLKFHLKNVPRRVLLSYTGGNSNE